MDVKINWLMQKRAQVQVRRSNFGLNLIYCGLKILFSDYMFFFKAYKMVFKYLPFSKFK